VVGKLLVKVVVWSLVLKAVVVELIDNDMILKFYTQLVEN
jgi:hypothetical protein